MDEKIKRDAYAVLWLAAAVFLAVALVSFSGMDPSTSSWRSDKAPPRNWAGPFGAHAADLLFAGFGVGALAFPALCLAMAWWTFRGEGTLRHWVRATGGGAAVCALLGILGFFTGEVNFLGSQVKVAGLLGLLIGKDGLGRLVGAAGGVILLSVVFLVALMMLTGLPLTALPALFARRERDGKDVGRERPQTPSSKRHDVSPVPFADDEDLLPPPPRPLAEPPRKPVAAKPRKAKPATTAELSDGRSYTLPSVDLLDPPSASVAGRNDAAAREMRETRKTDLQDKLRHHGIDGVVTDVLWGPLVTTFEFKPAPTVKISRVTAMSNDIALAMKCESVRIVPNIPGKGVMGFEIPNPHREIISFREILESPAYEESRAILPLVLGMDILGKPVVQDLTSMVHLLMAGSTGSGKSVALQSMILSILYRRTPEEVRLIMVDPKRLELTPYEDIPHLYHPVITDPREAIQALRWASGEMTGRYKLMQESGVRNIDTYNQMVEKRLKSSSRKTGDGDEIQKIPYIVIVIDELADLMMTAGSGGGRREVEELISRLSQMARAAGIHLIFATQRPSTDVITGLIKSNLPTRISLKVISQIDSRTILDQGGGEHLLGYGDMLLLQRSGGLMRIHGAYVSDDEIRRVADHLRAQGKPKYEEAITAPPPSEDEVDISQDPMFEKALEVVRQEGRASTSLLQRRLGIGYNRAAKIIDEMERQGHIGPADGGKPREVYVR